MIFLILGMGAGGGKLPYQLLLISFAAGAVIGNLCWNLANKKK